MNMANRSSFTTTNTIIQSPRTSDAPAARYRRVFFEAPNSLMPSQHQNQRRFFNDENHDTSYGKSRSTDLIRSVSESSCMHTGELPRQDLRLAEKNLSKPNKVWRAKAQPDKYCERQARLPFQESGNREQVNPDRKLSSPPPQANFPTPQKQGLVPVGATDEPTHSIPDAQISHHQPPQDNTAQEAARKEIVDELAAMLNSLKITQTADEKLPAALPEGCISLDEYLTQAAAGELIYNGKGTVEEKYRDGWAFNTSTRRWMRTAKAIEAAQKEQAEEKANALRSQLDNVLEFLKQTKEAALTNEADAETASTETQQAASTTSSAPLLAPPPPPPRPEPFACVVVDTNVLIDDLDLVGNWLNMIQRTGATTKIVVPRAAMIELDGLNHSRTLPTDTRHKIRDAIRFMTTYEAIIQADHEVYRDDVHHSAPQYLRGDDAIMNCCLYFSRVAGGKVTLVTRDKLFRVRASSNHITVEDPFYLNIHDM